MDLNPEEAYFKETKVILQFLGIWPFGSSTARLIQAVVAYATLLSSLFTQFASLATSDCNVDDVLSVLAVSTPCFAAVLKYTCFQIRMRKIRTIWEMLYRDWDELKKDQDAFRILREYGEQTRLFVIFFQSLAWSGILACPLLSTPKLLDIVAPLNHSRPKSFVIAVEYFVDHEKYFYIILLHMWVTFLIGVLTVLMSEVTMLVFTQHACGLFKITCYKLEHAADGFAQTCVRSLDGNRIVYNRIVDSVKIHSFGIRFVENIWEAFATSYVILILIGVMSISINMFRLARAVTMSVGYRKISGCTAFFLGQFAHLFLCNYFAQRLIDHSSDVFRKTYMMPWYDVSLPAQKLLLFILQRASKKTAFIAGSVFTASLEGFSALASTSFSYFTVIYSML